MSPQPCISLGSTQDGIGKVHGVVPLKGMEDPECRVSLLTQTRRGGGLRW